MDRSGDGDPATGTGEDLGLVQARLALAVQLTRDADAKAGGLLSGTGVLAAVGVLAADTAGTSSAVVRAAVLVCWAGLAVALVAVLLVLVPRGGPVSGWLPACDPRSELARMTCIVAVKHRGLRVAVTALVGVVAAGTTAAALVLAGAG